MKKWLFALSAILLLVACQSERDKTKLDITFPEQMPEDLAELRQLLSESKQAEKKLQKLNADLEERISELDSSVVQKISVTAIKATKKDFKHYAEVQAAVQADQPTMASSETGGRLITMPWVEGQTIRKGQVVATLDMEGVKKQIAELEKRLEFATTAYERQKRLWDQNIGSEMQYLQAKNNMESLQKTIETVRFQLTKATVYSPASGVVDRVMIQQGEMAGPGSPIIMIMNTSKVKVVAGVPEKYLKNVKKGERVLIKFPSLDEERTARVSLIGRTVNSANRTFDVEVILSNPGSILKPNLLAMMMINDETIKDAVMIPEELIRTDIAGSNYIYVVDKGDEDGQQARRVSVTAGSSFEGYTVIEEGLKGDELIVEKGGRELSSGQYIEVNISSQEQEAKKNNG